MQLINCLAIVLLNPLYPERRLPSALICVEMNMRRDGVLLRPTKEELQTVFEEILHSFVRSVSDMPRLVAHVRPSYFPVCPVLCGCWVSELTVRYVFVCAGNTAFVCLSFLDAERSRDVCHADRIAGQSVAPRFLQVRILALPLKLLS